jgi:rubrerythrin
MSDDDGFEDEYEEVVVIGALEGEPQGPGLWICNRCRETGEGPTPEWCPACNAPGDAEIQQI